jgi:probable phosphoglycerate mutase
MGIFPDNGKKLIKESFMKRQIRNRLRVSVCCIALTLAVGVGAVSASPQVQAQYAQPKSEAVDNSGAVGAVTFYVTRHGRTMFNTVHRAQGWADTPLTQPGVEVAEQLGKGLRDVRFDAAWSSDSGRARETALLVLANNGQHDLSLNESKNFRESGFGIYEGAYDAEMWGDAGKALGYETYEETMAALMSGGIDIAKVLSAVKGLDTTGSAEDYDTIRIRMRKQLDEIATATAAAGGGTVLVVAHGISILALTSDMTDKRPAGGQLENASVTKIVYTDGKYDVIELGSMDYVNKGKGL